MSPDCPDCQNPLSSQKYLCLGATLSLVRVPDEHCEFRLKIQSDLSISSNVLCVENSLPIRQNNQRTHIENKQVDNMDL